MTHADTETAAGHNRQVIDAAITSKREAIRLLRAFLGISGAEANTLYAEYKDALYDDSKTGQPDFEFFDWLIRQAPGPTRQRAVPKHPWRVTA